MKKNPNILSGIKQACLKKVPAVYSSRADFLHFGAYREGVNASSIFMAYANKTASTAIKEKAERIFFFTREGEFFLKVFNQLFPEGKVGGVPLPSPVLMEVSRLSTFAASLSDPSVDELMRLWRLYSTQSVDALFKSLALPAGTAVSLLNKHGIDSSVVISAPWEDPSINKLFNDAEFSDLLKKHISVKKQLLLEYAKNKGLHPGLAKVIIGDIGWRGTIQDNLATLFPGTQFTGIYVGLQKYLNPQLANCVKISVGPDLNSEMDTGALGDVTTLEMVSNSPSGSVIGYQTNESGVVVAIRQNQPEEDFVFHEFTCHFQQGVLDVAKAWAASKHKDRLDLTEELNVQKAIEQLRKRPAFSTSWALANLSHNEIFGVGDFLSPGHTDSWKKILKGIFRRKYRHYAIAALLPHTGHLGPKSGK